MKTRNIGIGEWAVTGDPEEALKTYALGSCVAVLIYDRKVRVAGLIHVALPDSSIDRERAGKQPGYFADTGLPYMIEEMKSLGATRQGVWVKLVGGASVMDPENLFDIGKRNILAIKRVLWKSSLGTIAEDTGGKISRTVAIVVEDGTVNISSGQKSWTI